MKRFSLFVVAFAFFAFAGFALPASVFQATKAEAATKAQWRYAKRACRKKYGRRLIKTIIRKNGKIVCQYRISRKRAPKPQTYEQVVEYCRKQYKGNVTINAYKRFGKWYCSWRE